MPHLRWKSDLLAKNLGESSYAPPASARNFINRELVCLSLELLQRKHHSGMRAPPAEYASCRKPGREAIFENMEPPFWRRTFKHATPEVIRSAGPYVIQRLVLVAD